MDSSFQGERIRSSTWPLVWLFLSSAVALVALTFLAWALVCLLTLGASLLVLNQDGLQSSPVSSLYAPYLVLDVLQISPVLALVWHPLTLDALLVVLDDPQISLVLASVFRCLTLGPCWLILNQGGLQISPLLALALPPLTWGVVFALLAHGVPLAALDVLAALHPLLTLAVVPALVVLGSFLAALDVLAALHSLPP